MKTYTIICRPDLRAAISSPGGPVEPLLTEDLFVQMLADVVVRDLDEIPWGQCMVEVELKRPSDEQALNDAISALWRLGFAFVEGIVNQWADTATERAVRWVLGDAAVDASIEDPVVGILATIISSVVGSVINNEEQKLQARYQASWNYRDSCWVFSRIPDPQPIPSVLRPRVSFG